MGNYGGELKKLRSHLDKQNSELARLSKDLQNRPQVDPNVSFLRKEVQIMVRIDEDSRSCYLKGRN